MEKLFIPKKCKVGFNLRGDTYNGKLGYVIYHDGKIWRKEDSWEKWREKFLEEEAVEKEKRKQYEDRTKLYKERYKYTDAQMEKALGTYEKFKPNIHGYVNDKTINPVEFDNVPTEGFVLNKKAGGNTGGWNPRATYCRVFDPRGFEFEITIPNLLFILQECNAMKGKGLEGEFVYSWWGKDLVLLPVECEEYRKSMGFTKMQSGKVGAKDMIPGCSYETKQLEKLTYLGRFNWHNIDYIKETDKDGNVNRYGRRESKTTLQYIFTNESQSLIHLSGLASLAKRNTETPVDNYAELMGLFSKDNASKQFIGLVEKESTWEKLEKELAQIEEKAKSYWYGHDSLVYRYLKTGPNKYTQYQIQLKLEQAHDNNGYKYKSHHFEIYSQQVVKFENNKVIILDKSNADDHDFITTVTNSWMGNNKYKKFTLYEVKNMKFINLRYKLEDGTEVNIRD